MPYWRLSGFYFFYFAALGALVPYWGLYLQDRGFGAVEIGQLMAVLMATKVLAPNVWGWIADRSGRRLPIVRLASGLATLIFGGIFIVQGFWGVTLVMALFSFFWNASLPQVEAATFNHLGLRIGRYAKIRLWGSIGFVVSVAALGPLVEALGTGLVPKTVLALFLAMWISSLVFPEGPSHPRQADPVSLRRLLMQREILAFLSACLLMQVSHSQYYTFFSIYLKESGYQGTAIGALWAWGVVAEVLVFVVMHRLLERFGARRVLLGSLLLAAVRWLLIGHFVTNPWVLIGAQALHAATFGTFHASAIHLVHHYFPGRVQGRGQALYSSLSFGAGGAIGSLAGGYLWEGFGPVASFSLAAGIAAIGALVVWRWVDRDHCY
jgi:MFS transporter, PPP family, 3-phenylpropionic acid transporter